MRSQSRVLRALFLLLTLLMMTGTALSQDPAVGRPLAVVVSLHPWADLVAQIGGQRVAVTTLLPAGASPHAFEPRPSQAVELASADLVVLNGGVDGWLERMLHATAPNVPTFRVMSQVEFEPLQEPDHGDARVSGDGHETEGEHALVANPHIWLDPRIVARAVPLLAAELARLDPDGSDRYSENAAALVADLEDLDRNVAALLAGLDERPFVPFHDAWSYFARRYGLTIAATLEPFPGREPSARYVADTVLAIRESGAAVVFNERQLNDRTARVVAESAGADVVTLDPVGGPPGAERYQDLLLQNARLIAEGLRRP